MDHLLKEEMGEEGCEEGASHHLRVRGDEEELRVREDVRDAEVTSESVASSRGGSGGDKQKKTAAALKEEVLYQALLRKKPDGALRKQVRTLFVSCCSVSAQESMLVSLRSDLNLLLKYGMNMCFSLGVGY